MGRKFSKSLVICLLGLGAGISGAKYYKHEAMEKKFDIESMRVEKPITRHDLVRSLENAHYMENHRYFGNIAIRKECINDFEHKTEEYENALGQMIKYKKLSSVFGFGSITSLLLMYGRRPKRQDILIQDSSRDNAYS